MPLQDQREEASSPNDQRFVPEVRWQLHGLGRREKAVPAPLEEQIHLGNDAPVVRRPYLIPGHATRVGAHFVPEVVALVEPEELVPQPTHSRGQ